MNVLIIGASGLVGGNCMNYFKAQSDWQVVGTYFSYEAQNTVFFDTLDLSNAKNFDIDSFPPDVVLHCGALTHVDYCEDHVEESYEKTVQSTKNIIELCRRYQAKMVFISTDYVFDGHNGPYDETAATNALSVYGQHKLEAENLVREHIQDHLILRITNVYGDEERGKNFIARVVDQILEGKKLTLKVPNDQFATPINAHDIARCLFLLLNDQKTGIYNIASTDFMSRVQLCLRILHHFPNAEYDLFPLSTVELNQKANRPLMGGLINKKFMLEYPDFTFSTVDDYMEKQKG
ncbi:MAG: SDR family oxidoreductase [Bacteroidetes bacterium]|nr:SDR family oxidoreductase [Bacteroidota bacterium]